MNKSTLLSVGALALLLSCQNESVSPAAAPKSTGSLALRVVSATPLAQVESVTVRLSWPNDSSKRTSGWAASSLKLDGLPLDVRLAVHMEGWNPVRGRHVIVWSGDTTVTLDGNAAWDMDQGAPIRIVSSDSSTLAAPNLAQLLPSGYVVVNDSLKRSLTAGKPDTIRLGTTGVDSVLVDGKSIPPTNGQYLVVVRSGDAKTLLVVGTNGQATTVRVVAFTTLPAVSALVKPSEALASWNKDTVSFSLKAGASDTVRIDTVGVDSVILDGKPIRASGEAYEILVTSPDTLVVVVKGAFGQSKTVTIRVRAADFVVGKPGLGASLRPLPDWVGAVCQLRVVIDSGTVDSVVLLGDHSKFDPLTESLFAWDWTTEGASDSIEIHVYGTGTNGRDSVMLGRKLSFDRQGPTIVVAGGSMAGLVVGRSGGTVSWKAEDERGVASTWATDTGSAIVSCPMDDSCQARGAGKTFVVHAKDNLGNQTDSVVKVVMDSIGPVFKIVTDASDDGVLKDGDTLWVDSATKTTAVRVSAFDSLSGFLVRAKRVGTGDTILVGGSVGGVVVSGLGLGTWDLLARDTWGNPTNWGRLVVAVRATVVETKPGLGAHLANLPAWVGATCSVTVVRDSGRIDAVTGSGLAFSPNADSTHWSALWTTSTTLSSDSLQIAVVGQGAGGTSTLHLGRKVSIDRAGPTIALTSRPTDSAYRVGLTGGLLEWSAQDNRGVDTVWLSGSDAGIVTRTGAGTYRSTVLQSVTIHATDSLGNSSSLLVRVVRDTSAPKIASVVDGLAHGIAPGGLVGRDSVTGIARLVVAASDSSGFLVRLSRVDDGSQVAVIAGAGGKAVLDSLPVGTFSVSIEDSLGNVVDLNEGAWGTVVVRPYVKKPTFSKPAGTYGAESAVYNTIYDVDAIALNVVCTDGASLIRRESASSEWMTGSLSFFWGSGDYDFRCLLGKTDTSRAEIRTYNVLQRPAIAMPDSTYGVDSLKIAILVDSVGSSSKNPQGSFVQYFLGIDTTGAAWSTYSSPVAIKGTQTLWARVAYDGKVSHVVQRVFTQLPGISNWTRTFDTDVSDTTQLRTTYGTKVWSLYSRDTAWGVVQSKALKLEGVWQITGRLSNQYGLVAIDLPLDLDGSVYDFSAVDTIEFQYSITGTLNTLGIYPVAQGDTGSGVALSAHLTGGANNTKAYIRMKDLEYPAWSSPSTIKTWSEVGSAIKALRFQIEPQTGVGGVPKDAMTTLTIDNIVIHGRIVKK